MLKLKVGSFKWIADFWDFVQIFFFKLRGDGTMGRIIDSDLKSSVRMSDALCAGTSVALGLFS